MSSKTLVVFDFDWSFVDQDTDRYIFEVLRPEFRVAMKGLKDTVQWTDLVAMHLVKLHEEGFKPEQIKDALKRLPFHPAVQRGVEAFKAQTGATFLCLSNSNQVFIDTILKHYGLQDFFTEVITNTAEWHDSGLLKLQRRVKPDGPQHQCKVGCSPNMCKGEELDNFVARHGGYEAWSRIIYVGDGSNDFCPLLRMRSQDVAFCRRFRGLEAKIEKQGKEQGLKVEVEKWTGAWEMEQLFRAESAKQAQ